MIDNPSPQTPLSEKPQTSPYWRFWGTIGFGFLIFTVFGIIQSVILIAFGFYREGLDLTANDADIQKVIEKFAYNGDLISLAEIPSALIGIALIFLFITLKKTLSINDYLQLQLPTLPIKTFLKWIGIMILVFILMEVTNQLLGRETPEFMTKLYASTHNKVLLWVAVVIAAPLFEEFLFRGFLLEGLRHSRLGVVGAIILTSASWAIIHLQYGWFEIVTIFLIGILFAVAKLKSKSLYVPIAMHMFMNFTASVMMEIAP